jgi:hypothetical protein
MYSSTTSVNALILHCFCNVGVPVLPYITDLHDSQNLWYPFHVQAPDQNITAFQRGTRRTTFLRHCCVDRGDVGSFPSSERVCSAIALMNYLHSWYQKAGKISNDDLLYTLSLFVLEVERWVRLYDWRTLTPLEMCAL